MMAGIMNDRERITVMPKMTETFERPSILVMPASKVYLSTLTCTKLCMTSIDTAANTIITMLKIREIRSMARL